jgi:hypothetical protein
MSSDVGCGAIRFTHIEERFQAQLTPIWSLATVNSGMHLQATLLGESHLAAIFWADKRSLTCMRPIVPFQIGFPPERLIMLRGGSELTMEVSQPTFPQDSQSHFEVFMTVRMTVGRVVAPFVNPFVVCMLSLDLLRHCM